MSKYIPIDKRYYTGRQVCDILSEGLGIAQFRYMLELFSREPSAIVRCRDCEYWSNSFTLNGRRRCLNTSICTDEDFYCGWGSRKDE